MYRPLEGSEELLDTNTERLGWILMEDTLEGGEKVEVKPEGALVRAETRTP